MTRNVSRTLGSLDPGSSSRNRGHYFGTSLFNEEPGLSDDDKRALIELLKTL